MIEYLRGTLLKKGDGHVVLDVGGVGYGMDVPLTAFSSLPEIGQQAEFVVYFHVQMAQGAAGFSLYGFLGERDRELFLVLISAPGIGPSKALDIMSAIQADDLARAVLSGDLVMLGKLKGIGKKTAEKLIVNLRDKMKRYALEYIGPEPAAAAGGRTLTPAQRQMEGIPTGAAALRDAVEALESLGVKPLTAERAALKAYDILGPEAATAELVKEALKHRK